MYWKWVFLATCVSCKVVPYSREHISQMKEDTRDLFLHGWSLYMEFGFPYDEVLPDSCTPYGPDYNNVDDIGRNDVLSNTSMLILDNLDTLIIMDQWDQLDVVLTYLNLSKDTFFEQDTVVQVFEQCIRLLGGLLSTHLLLEKLQELPKYKIHKPIADYDGFLLNMAYTLGTKLIPAFKTSTNIPVPRINLLTGPKGVPERLQRETCTSGAATPVLEFTLLSRLTGEIEFETYSAATFWKLWNSRSSMDLLPMTLDPIRGDWKDSVTGIGASGDSFYEYAAKLAIIFDDSEMWQVFVDSYKALITSSRQYEKLFFPNINSFNGQIASFWIDLLSAFWAGLQVLTGQVSDAIYTHLMYWKIWNTFDLLPEQWIFTSDQSYKRNFSPINLEWYPLRPEFIESTYYLYRATRDPMYLRIGEKILELLKTRYKAKCGFHGFQDIRIGEMQDRMETFVLSETLKYLYLLFDEKDESFLHNEIMKDVNWVFSTEAHPLWNPKSGNETLNKLVEDSLKEIRDPNYKLNYRNTIIRQSTPIGNTEIPTTTKRKIRKIDPMRIRFNQCEAPGFKLRQFSPNSKKFKSQSSFLEPSYSMYYNNFDLFLPDSQYQNYLKRPKYLGKQESFELNMEFFRQFSLGSQLQSKALRTSQISDMVIGDPSQFRNAEVNYIQPFGPAEEEQENLPMDLWVPYFNNVRITIEKFQSGDITTREVSFLRSHDSKRHLDKTKKGKGRTKKEEKEMYRILKINGVDVGSSKIWILPDKNDGIFKYSRHSKVYFDDHRIENMYAW